VDGKDAWAFSDDTQDQRNGMAETGEPLLVSDANMDKTVSSWAVSYVEMQGKTASAFRGGTKENVEFNVIC